MNDIECVDSRLDMEAEEARLINFLTMVGSNSFWVHSNAQKIADACSQAVALLQEKNRQLFEIGALMSNNTNIGLLEAQLEEANRENQALEKKLQASVSRDVKIGVLEAKLKEAIREKQEAERKIQDAFTRGVLAGMKQAGADHGK